MEKFQHKDADEIIKIIKKNGVRYLYHFTNIDNLRYISEFGGLLSKSSLDQIGILDKIKTGGNQLSKDLDIKYGNWDKVSLNWGPKMPMMWHIQQQNHLCLILIKIEVTLRNGVIFTDRNAADSNCKRDLGLKGIELVDFSCVTDPTAHTDQQRKKMKQAEVLIPNKIETDMFEYIAFISEASLKEGERLWGDKPKPPFKINKNLFHEGFPYVESAILTSSKLSKDNVNSKIFTHQNEFIITQIITLLSKIEANTGTIAQIKWSYKNGNIIYETQHKFDNQGCYWYWVSSPVNLNNGYYFVTIYLDNIRWIQIPFKIKS